MSEYNEKQKEIHGLLDHVARDWTLISKLKLEPDNLEEVQLIMHEAAHRIKYTYKKINELKKMDVPRLRIV